MFVFSSCKLIKCLLKNSLTHPDLAKKTFLFLEYHPGVVFSRYRFLSIDGTPREPAESLNQKFLRLKFLRSRKLMES